MVWAYGSYVGGRLLVLVATAILARLLSPDDFGVVALALVFTGLLYTIRDFGVTQALIVAPEDELSARADSAFVFSLLLGVALSAIVLALSPLAALFFHEPELKTLLPLLGLSFITRSFGTTHYALAQRRLDFRSRTAAEFADVFVRGFASIGFAVAGFGAYSLVLGYVVGELALSLAMWALVPWRPRLRLQRQQLAPLLGFGGALTGVDVLAAVYQNVDYVFVGRVLGTAALGVYTLAFRLPDLIINNLTIVASTVLFPAFARVEREALRYAYLTTIRYTVMLTLPLAVALAILAEPFILAAFGEKWRGAVTPMQILVLYALFPAMTTPPGVIYKAIGRADILLKLSLIRTPLLIAALALFVDKGITAVAACQAGVVVLFFFVTTAIASRMLEVALREIGAAVWPPLAASAVLALALAAVHRLIEAPWPALAVGTIAGAAVYLGALWVLAPDALRDLRARIARRGPNPQPEPSATSVR
ncbi:MAG: lipopolysaccharide biosynthesis protein [Actinomycetota bacterium]|nr:lipopolysaccharide biosynthesis protein [Actinomycetota bacterium]